MRKTGWFILWATLGVVAPRYALACAVCGCGDPTLSVTGTEAPLAGRIRTGMELRALEDQWAGPAGGVTVMRDIRSTFVASWAPTRHLLLSVASPLVMRDVVMPNLARLHSVGVGDTELRARVFVFQDRTLSPLHQVAVHGGVLLPTALALMLPEQVSRMRKPQFNGADEAVGGLASVAPVAGLTYQARPYRTFLLQSTLNLQVPVAFLHDTRVGAVASWLTAAHWQPVPGAALRALAELRATSPTRVLGAGVDKNSGGNVLFGGAEVVLSPWVDTLFTAAVRIPVWTALHGQQRLGPILTVGVIRDWS